MLRIYDRNRQTELHTDASMDGFGAVLLQRCPDDGKFHSVQFMSHKMSEEQRKLHSYVLEVLAVITALRKFRNYLLGVKFKLVTNYLALKQTMQKKEVSVKIWRWAEEIQNFDCEIEHRPGTKMCHVDALSRHPVFSIEFDDITARIMKLQQEDDELKLIRDSVALKEDKKYSLRSGLLYKLVDGIDLLVVPNSMENEIIRSIHERGHGSSKKTQDLIKQECYIPQLRSKVDKFIANCVRCIIGNRKEGKQEGFLHPLQKPDVPLYTFHMDHLGPLQSTSKRYNHILAVIDSFSKFTWLYPTRSTTSAEVIEKLNKQKHIFGNPQNIITDRGTAFSSNEFKRYCEEEGIKHSMITTGLPRANGQIERVNRTLIPVLTKLSVEDPSKWYIYVDKLQNTLNSAFHSSIATTPFELLIGVKMRSQEDLHLKELLEEELRERFVEDRQELRLEAKAQILKTQLENRKTYKFAASNSK